MKTKIGRLCEAALLAYVTGAAGCSAGAGTQEAQLEESLDPVVEARELAFEDPSDDGFRLDVVELSTSDLVLSVSMPAGNDELLAATRGAESVAELYALLHDGAAMPAELAELAPDLDLVDAEPRSIEELGEGGAAVEKSQAEFNSLLCRAFSGGGKLYTAQECRWTPFVSSQTVSSAKNIRRGDRTYFYNKSGVNARVTWVSRTNVTFDLGTFPHDSYGFVALVFPENSPERFLGRLSTTTGSSGELGLTWHLLQP